MATYTEFYCQSGGSNLNAGSTPANAASLTYASGSWVQSTRVFTVASGNPVSDGVAVGDFVSVYADGSSATGYVARVTARDATTITLSATIKAGSAPTDGTGDRTLKVGGAWLGPNGSSGFPFSLNTSIDALTNAAGNAPRVNLKNDATYSVTAAVSTQTRASNGLAVEGYTTTPGDGGRAVIDGGTTGASYALFTLATTLSTVRNMEVRNNGAAGSASGLSVTANGCLIENVVVHDVRGVGFDLSGVVEVFQCEAYACNQSNTSGKGGFLSTAGASSHVRCIAHDNAGSNTFGFGINNAGAGGSHYHRCIADTNGGVGFQLLTSQNFVPVMTECDAYNNGSHGAAQTAGFNFVVIENSNFVKNGGYGLNLTGALGGRVRNCGFGSGTQANTSGATSLPTVTQLEVTGSVTYAADVTPWVDPANGDFRITLAAAKGVGAGAYTQTQSGYSGTVGYPDIGAVQHQDSGGGGGPAAVLKVVQNIGTY